ncbi:hypothetical protein ABEG63_01355 [Chryseobacterium sp. C39-AII1]|uniref:beta strand repeat-containing protein n=1 Tax=Chryseobacterium sp. C39-AII1 TaxID=3080332 RepID=UPI00320B15F8
MKSKHFYPLIAAFAFNGLYGQVGINTTNPQSTLDIVGNGVSTSTKDGVTAPRITRQQLAAKVSGTYAAAQSGTLVYVTDAGTPTGTTPSLAQTANITKVGYYYFDGTVWKQISDTDSPSVNIYNADGTLTGNRIVTQGANTLAFNGSVVNAFSVDGSTLSVNAANDRLGIGTSAPETKLHVVSTTPTSGRYNVIDAPQSTSETPILVLRNTSALATDNKTYLGFSNAGPTAGGADWQLGSIRTSAAAGGVNQDFYIGNATTGTLNERFRIASNGNVGLGVADPVAKMDIVGSAFGMRMGAVTGSWDNLWFNLTASIPSINASGAENGLQFNVGTNSTGTYGDGQTLATVATMRANGNMGVGTTNPLQRLHIVSDGTSTTPVAAIRIEDGNQAAGKILTSDANGVGTWQSPAAQSSVNIYNTDGTLTGNRIVTQGANTLAFTSTATNGFSVAGTTLSVDGANNRVGVGTIAPRSRFEIVADNVGGGAANDFNLTGYGSSKNPALFLSSSNGTAAAPTNLAINDIVGGIYFTPRYNGGFSNGSTILSNYRGDGTTNLTDLIFSTSNAERLRIDPTGNVGIGNTAPTVKLDINSGGTSTTPVAAVKIVDGNQGVGRILTSDANGVGTWQSPAAQSSVNIYNTDGTLTGNRIVTQGANTLAFTSTATNGFSVDGSTFSVDAANGRVGIGTIAPRSRFEIVADNLGGGAANDFNLTGYGNSKNPALFLSSSNGTAAAPTNLAINDIVGGIYFTPRYNGGFSNGSTILSNYRGDGTTNLTDLIFSTSNAERLRIDPTGNVGIGNTAPTVKLDINSGGTSTTPVAAVKIVDGNQGVGRILTSDANGVGTWQDASAASVNLYNSNGSLTGNRVVTQAANTLAFTSTATNGFSVDGSTFSVDAANDRLGVGTTAPSNTLDVNGTLRVRSINGPAGSEALTPLYADGTGIVVRTSSSTQFGILRNGVTLAAGATGAVVTGLVNGGVYKLLITSGDACGNTIISEFYVSSISTNGYFTIKGLDGLIPSGTDDATKKPTFTESARGTTAVTWSGKPLCAPGGGTSGANFTVTVSNPIGSINITNNGDASRSYVGTLTRLN